MLRNLLIILATCFILNQIIIIFNSYKFEKYVDLGSFRVKTIKKYPFYYEEKVSENCLSKYLIENNLVINSTWVHIRSEANGMYVSMVFGGKLKTNLEFGKLESDINSFNKWLENEISEVDIFNSGEKKDYAKSKLKEKVIEFIELLRKKR